MQLYPNLLIKTLSCLQKQPKQRHFATTIITKLILIFGNQLGGFFPITAIYNWK
jgi:hypothetical protein